MIYMQHKNTRETHNESTKFLLFSNINITPLGLNKMDFEE